MDTRQRSPSYPSTPLGEAIDLVRKVHNMERTNPVDREVAAKAMGYSGISGRSATVLSNLIQFGFLEKTGKNEVRVTRRAIDVLYPDTDESKADALRAAAREPELFQAISDRFPDGRPSEAALQSYLIRQGFTHTAVSPATRAFLETFLFLENAIGSESHSLLRDGVIDSQQDQRVEKGLSMNMAAQTPTGAQNLSWPGGKPQPSPQSQGFDVRINQKTLWLAGTVHSQAEADDLIATITALRPMLHPSVVQQVADAPEESDAPD